MGTRRRPVLTGISAVLVVLVLLPLGFLVDEAFRAGWTTVWRLLARPLTATLLVNSVVVAVVVTAASAVIGTGAAWLTERTALPGRRIWSVLIVLPVAIPDFVIAVQWESIAPSLHGLAGSALAMTLGLYPLVYLPVAGSFRSADPTQEEVARGLGMGPLATFFSVTLRQARLAILGGCLLVMLYLFAEYGAYAVFGYRTFTTEIYTQLQVGFNTPMACALSLVLVTIGMVVLAGEAGASRIGFSGLPPARSRRPSRIHLRGSLLPSMAVLGALVAVAVGLPVGTIVYWLVAGQRSSLPAMVSLGAATGYTILYSASAAVVATAAALPVAILSVRSQGRLALLLERGALLVQALPGLVIALGLVFFSERVAHLGYQSAPMLVVAYAIVFFPLALVAVRASVARSSPVLEDVARASGRGPLAIAWRVTLPLVTPGLLAAFSLVFLSAVTELTATLVLVPTGVQTLATQSWAYSSELSFGAAAPYAAVMLAIAVLPTYVLGRWFDRLPSRRPVGIPPRQPVAFPPGPPVGAEETMAAASA